VAADMSLATCSVLSTRFPNGARVTIRRLQRLLLSGSNPADEDLEHVPFGEEGVRTSWKGMLKMCVLVSSGLGLTPKESVCQDRRLL
jgi:hypothetical protein